MARVAKVSVDLEANSAKFEAGLNRATSALNSAGAKWNRQVSVVNKGMVGLGAAIGAITAGAIVTMGKQFLDAAGGIGELASQTGVSTDFLQEMEYGAVQAGLRIEELQKGLAKLTDSIGAAANGEKEQIDAFNELGVRILDVNGKTRSTEEILMDVANAYQGMSDKTRAASLIVDIFGRAGQRLIPMLENGAIGLNDMRGAAHTAGAVLETDLIAQADTAADKIAAMEQAAAKAGQTFMAKLAPAITAILNAINGSNSLDDIKDKLSGLYDERARLAAQPMTGENYLRLQLLDLEVAETEKLILKVRQLKAEGAAAPGGAGNPTVKASGKTDEQKAAEKSAKAIADLQFEQEQLGRTAREQFVYNEMKKAGVSIGTDAADTIAYEAGKLYDATQGLNALDAAERAYLDTLYEKRLVKDDINAATENEIADNDRLIAALQTSEAEYEKIKAQLEILNRYRRAGIEMSPAEVAAAERLSATLGRQHQQMKDLEDRYDTAKRLGADIGMTFTSAFEDAVIAGEKFGDVLKSLAQDIARLVLRETVTAPAAKGISSVITDIIGSFGGGKASGGPVSPANWYAVGEKGPEIFVPDTAGTIIPHDALGAGGGGTTIYADLRGADMAAVQRLERYVRGIDASLEKRSVGAVVAARQRNPKLLG